MTCIYLFVHIKLTHISVLIPFYICFLYILVDHDVYSDKCFLVCLCVYVNLTNLYRIKSNRHIFSSVIKLLIFSCFSQMTQTNYLIVRTLPASN